MQDKPHLNTETATTCPYCGVGCGVLAAPSVDGLSAAVRGDPEHPSNFGKLCSKGSSLGETLSLGERLLYPSIGGEQVDWDTALDAVASGFKKTIEEHGPDSVAFYVSGQILTEDYYVANKLMKGFIGSSNIDTNSRLCMASSVVGHKRAFGTDTVPGCYDDLEQADLVVIVGSNFAWCHPILHQRLMSAKERRGTRIVVVDPRQTATTQDAEQHLPVQPGTDVALFNGLLAYLVDTGAVDEEYIESATEGFGEVLTNAGDTSLDAVSRITGVSGDELERFYKDFTSTQRVVTIYSQGVNQSSAGSDKVNSILNVHLATGRIGKPGMGPFSITGQPNAMGGREVGGLANQLAAHMDFAPEDHDRVKRFWRAPNVADGPGLKAVDMFDAVHSGKIKAIWIMATNPVVSLPNADKVREALENCPLVVVSEASATADTAQCADVLLPATAWGEKTGTVTNSERRISRQRSFLAAPGEARHDWAAMCGAAQRMGYSGFDYDDVSEIYAEYAQLSGFENTDTRDFDISAHAKIDKDAYDALKPFQWPLPAERDRPGSVEGDEHRFFADGKFYTPNRRARFLSVAFRPPESACDDDFPLVLNTGRVRDQWHTMTRTGLTPRLTGHIGEPFVEINPKTADMLGLTDFGIAKIISRQGAIKVRVLKTDRAPEGQVFVPMHWTDRYSVQARVDSLVAENVDPASGQPESKFTPVRIKPLKLDWYAFAVLSEEPNRELLDIAEYWAVSPAPLGWRVELAGEGNGTDVLKHLVGNESVLTLQGGKAFQSAARLNDVGVLEAACFVSNVPVEADRAWLSELVGTEVAVDDRLGLLAARARVGASAGRMICACMGVSSSAINTAIEAGCGSVEAVGEATKAGTNCGSCKPDIRRLISQFGSELTEENTVAAE